MVSLTHKDETMTVSRNESNSKNIMKKTKDIRERSTVVTCEGKLLCFVKITGSRQGFGLPAYTEGVKL